MEHQKKGLFVFNTDGEIKKETFLIDCAHFANYANLVKTSLFDY